MPSKYKKRPKMPDLDRFFLHLRACPSGCVEYSAANSAGYGVFSVNRKSVRAHRYAWEAAVGPIPEGLKVLHKCDNPACVNVAHLFLGTTKDNHDDSVRKGRQREDFHGSRLIPKGETNGNAKLTAEIVREIRSKYVPGKYGKVRLAREFGIDPSHALRIVSGVSWPFEPIPQEEPMRRHADVREPKEEGR